MAKRVGVTAWWIERATGQLCSHRFDDLPTSGNYSFEVDIKYANDAVDTLIVNDDRAGNDQSLLEALKTKAEAMRQEIHRKV